jgi:hypothetical protein
VLADEKYEPADFYVSSGMPNLHQVEGAAPFQGRSQHSRRYCTPERPLRPHIFQNTSRCKFSRVPFSAS